MVSLWFERLKAERVELAERLDKLDTFIFTNPLFDSFPIENKILFQRQSAYMSAYLNILDLRIANGLNVYEVKDIDNEK